MAENITKIIKTAKWSKVQQKFCFSFVPIFSLTLEIVPSILLELSSTRGPILIRIG